MIPAERAHLHTAGLSHPGMSGKNNEDRYAISAYRAGPDDPTPAVLAVIADGIGGHRAGEIAAELAVERISRAVAESDAREPGAALSTAIVQASQAVYELAGSNPDFAGMGATAVCAWVIGDRLYTASVGDSRLYLLRPPGIRQLTTDHTWIQEALDSGVLTPEQARDHPNMHIIRRYLGSPQPPAADLRLRLSPEESDAQALANQGLRLQEKDILLLCSDGLSDLVSQDEILAAFQDHRPEEALQALVALANQRGGHDNITLLALAQPQAPRPAPAGSSNRRRLAWIGIGLGMLLLCWLALILLVFLEEITSRLLGLGG
jgi:protein phosphatase